MSSRKIKKSKKNSKILYNIVIVGVGPIGLYTAIKLKQLAVDNH